MVYLGIGLNIQFAVYLVVEVCSIKKESATLLHLNMVVKIVMAQLVKIVLARKLNVQVFWESFVFIRVHMSVNIN